MLGRHVAVLLRPACTRLPIRTAQSQHPLRLGASGLLRTSGQRGYATPGRPRTAVGEPSRPVKRAVKREARSPTASASKAAPRKAATKGAKKKVVKAKAKAKAKPKSKLKPKKKLVRKTLTPERQELKELQDLRKAAFGTPPPISVSAYNMLVKEKTHGSVHSTQGAIEKMREASGEFQGLSPAEREHYNHLAATATEANRALYKQWVEKHTVGEIAAANRARAKLRRKLTPTGKTVRDAGRWRSIRDERRAKRPVPSFAIFTRTRNASGDFSGISLPDRQKLISQEWRALDASEKEKYSNLAKSDSDRYHEEQRAHLGSGALEPLAQAAAAA